MENISIQIGSAVTDAQKENPNLKLSNELASITDQERLKYFHLKNTMNISERFPKELLYMHTFLFKAPSEHEFFISDRPILRVNYYGDFNGYETPGIEILVPISDKFYIVFFHKGFIQTLAEVNNTRHFIKQRLLDFIDNDYSNNKKSRIILDSRGGNKPIVSLAALQIINSAQYLNANHTFCSSQKYLEESIRLFEKYSIFQKNPSNNPVE